MSRSGYSDDFCGNEWDLIRWRGAVNSAIKGRRGQAFLKEMLAALEALPNKRLIPHELENSGEVCAIGAVGRARGVDMSKLEPCREVISGAFNIAEAMAAEIMFENDEWGAWRADDEAPEHRYERMKRWVESQIK